MKTKTMEDMRTRVMCQIEDLWNDHIADVNRLAEEARASKISVRFTAMLDLSELAVQVGMGSSLNQRWKGEKELLPEPEQEEMVTIVEASKKKKRRTK